MQIKDGAQTGALQVGPYQGSVNPPRTPTSELLPDRKIEVSETPEKEAAEKNDEREKSVEFNPENDLDSDEQLIQYYKKLPSHAMTGREI
jgi:hypothetical protein